jgi:hypothetical protein
MHRTLSWLVQGCGEHEPREKAVMSRYTLLPGGQDDSLIVVEEEKPGACVRCGSTDAAAFPLDKRGLSLCGQRYREAVGVSVFIEDAREAVPA